MLTNSQKIAHGGYPVFIKLVDFFSINLILILSGWLLKIESIDTVILFSLLFSTSFLLFGEYTEFYQYRTKNRKLHSQRRLIVTSFLSVAFIEIIRVSVNGFHSLGYLDAIDSRFISPTIFWYAVPLVFIYFIRLIIFKYSARKSIRVAIIGVTDNGLVAEKALREEYSDTQLDLAFYDERIPSRFGDLGDKINSPFKGPVINLVEEAKAGRIDEIYIALPLVALERIRHFLTMMSDTTVDTYIVPDFYAYSSNMSQIRTVDNL